MATARQPVSFNVTGWPEFHVPLTRGGLDWFCVSPLIASLKIRANLLTEGFVELVDVWWQ